MDRIRLIESYIDGSMSQIEKEQFEALLREDNELRRELSLFKNVNSALLDEDTVRFRRAVRKIIEKKNGKVAKMLHAIKYPLAASILILICLSLWKLFFFRESPAALYTAFYTPYQSDISTRSVEQSGDNVEYAYLLYEEGDYETSFSILQTYLTNNVENPTAHYYLGLNALELRMYDLAIEEFTVTEQDPMSPFALHARWYIALTYLQLNRPEETVRYLNGLVHEKNVYTESAGSILKKLKP